MLDSILESVHVVALPTRTNFRSVQLREIALFQGPEGWGEFSPFLEYGEKECVPWLVSGIESATNPPIESLRSKIEINATMPAINDRDEIALVLAWFPGCKTVKIKVGANLKEDLARIAYVRQLLPNARIRIDVNGGWSVDNAVDALHAILQEGDIEYVEQPCDTLAELRELKSRLDVPIPIAGDEVIRRSSNPLTIDLNGAVDILILKVAPLGGIKRSMEIARAHELPVVVSSAIDSAVGISAGLRLAAALPELNYACGLGTGQLLAADVATLPIEEGCISVQSVIPDEASLQKYAVSPERLNWWRRRIRQTWNAGAQEWVTKEGWEW